MLGNLEGTYKTLWVAPNSFKDNVIRLIEEEKQKAEEGAAGRIIIKCNSLTDKEILEALADASIGGVEVSVIVRGICCLIPGLQGLTENIRIISIVGRFLEHSRIFCFGSGPDQKIYISSADLMTRNTQRRVEIGCPVLDPSIKEMISQSLAVSLSDNTQAWEQYSDGSYVSRCSFDSDYDISSQEIFRLEKQELLAPPDPPKKAAEASGGFSFSGFVKKAFRI